MAPRIIKSVYRPYKRGMGDPVKFPVKYPVTYPVNQLFLWDFYGTVFKRL